MIVQVVRRRTRSPTGVAYAKTACGAALGFRRRAKQNRRPIALQAVIAAEAVLWQIASALANALNGRLPSSETAVPSHVRSPLPAR
jgi:hypothetical protein